MHGCAYTQTHAHTHTHTHTHTQVRPFDSDTDDMHTASVKSPEDAQGGGGSAKAMREENKEKKKGSERHPRLRKETDTATCLKGGAEIGDLLQGTSSGADSDSRCVGVVRALSMRCVHCVCGWCVCKIRR